MSHPSPHVCDVRAPDGTRTGACHLTGSHGGPCPTCHQHADDCAHVPPVDLIRSCPEVACAVHGGWVVEPGTALDLVVPPDRRLVELTGLVSYADGYPPGTVARDAYVTHHVVVRAHVDVDPVLLRSHVGDALTDLDDELRTAREDPP